MNIYYVYVLLNPLLSDSYVYDNLQFSYKPFYVGKGKKRRVYESMKISESNSIEKNDILKSIGFSPLFQIIESGLSESDALIREQYYIKLIGRNNLVNQTDGGDSPFNQTGNLNPFYGKTRDNDWKESHSKKVAGSKHGMYNKKHSDDTLLKIKNNSNLGKDLEWSEKWQQNNIDNQKKVYQYDSDMNLLNIFDSVKQASILTGYTESKISKHCRGEILTPKPFYWKYDDNDGSKVLRNSYLYKIGDLYNSYIIISRTRKTCTLQKGLDIINIRRIEDSELWTKKSI